MKTSHLKAIIIFILAVSAWVSFWQTFSDAHEEILAEAKEAQNVRLSLSAGDILIMRTLLSQISSTPLAPERQIEIDALTKTLGTLQDYDIKKEGEGATFAIKKIDSSLYIALRSTFQLTVILPLILAFLTAVVDLRGLREKEQ